MNPLFIVIMLLALLAIGSAIVIGGLRLNTSHIPGPFDAQMLLEAAAGITKTADFAGTPFDFGSGYAPGSIGQPMAAVAQVTALDLSDSSHNYTLTLTESDDGETFTPCGPSVSVLTAEAISVPGFVSKRYAALALDVDGDAPSITYKAHLVPLGTIG